jgi:riboflavin biosynthesis pyrimidine reductase
MQQPTSGKPDYTALTFPAAPPDRPTVILNMVSSVDGRAVVEGTERGLGSPVDQRLMRELRVHADVVLNGAGTLRASGTSSRTGDPALAALRVAHGKSEAAIAAVLSASGDLPLDRAFFSARDFEAVVYLSEAAPPARLEALLATGRRVVLVPAGDEVGTMLRHMRTELGATLLVVEGGPTLNGELLAAGLVDEVFLTVGPVLIGGRDARTIVEDGREGTLSAATHLELLSAAPNAETGEVYLRYRVVRD